MVPIFFFCQKNKQTLIEEKAVLGFTFPFSVEWCFSINGAEYCHVYLWICKDLAWTQNWRYFSLSFGILALSWWSIIIYHAIRTKNFDEIFNALSVFLWLFANFWWMTGEVYDYTFPDEQSISEGRTEQCARILEIALCLLTMYYTIILPLNLVQVDEKALKAYNDEIMKPRFAYFKNFRQYENVHMYFWIAKDLSWNQSNKLMWLLFLGPTLFLSADYIFLSLLRKNATIDTVHFLSGFIWVIGNSIWAFGELFYSSQDGNQQKLLILNKRSIAPLSTAYENARWFSACFLILSLLLIFAMYACWFYLTIFGHFPHNITGKKKVKISRSSKLYGDFDSSSLSNRINNHHGLFPIFQWLKSWLLPFNFYRSEQDGKKHDTSSFPSEDPTEEFIGIDEDEEEFMNYEMIEEDSNLFEEEIISKEKDQSNEIYENMFSSLLVGTLLLPNAEYGEVEPYPGMS